MSLVGNLEDLGLGDITQIVSLSRKSGVLLIERGSNKAKVIFRDGQVLAAFTNADRQDPAGLLVARGILDERAASAARERHRASGGAESIQACLVAAGAPADAAQEAARSEIERAVLELFGWEDGDFSFDLKDVDEDLAKVRAHPHRVIYEVGLNPQFLLMEASRLVDEARRAPKGPRPEVPREARADSEPEIRRAAAVDTEIARGDSSDETRRAAPADFETVSAGSDKARVEPEPEPEAARVAPEVTRAAAVDTENARADSVAEVPRERPLEGASDSAPAVTASDHSRKLIVVDDDDRFLRRIAPVLGSWGYALECFPGGGPAAERIEALSGEGEPIVVLSDLLMPRVDGSGLLGGIELLERVRRRFASLPFVLLADHLQEEAEARARLLDVDFTIAKPRAAVLAEGPDSPAWRGFLGVLKPILESFRPAAVGVARDQGTAEGTIDLRRALGGYSDPELFADGERPPDRATTPGLAILKSMLCELTNPEAGAEITLLVLRFAAEIMNRGVLFMVKDREAIGLGGFGLGPGVLGEEAPASRGFPVTRGAALRRMRIPLDVPSVFHDVVEKRSVVRGRPESSPGNERLRGLLGGGQAIESFVAPITVGDEVAALLYGDNLPGARPVGDTEALEIFLTQAGLALEKAILERRLSETGRGQG